MFWIIIGVMLATAMLVIMWPLYRVEKRFSVTAIVSMVSVAVISATLYSQIGTPDSDSRATVMPDLEEMVSTLALRLVENPDDLAGWKMLGRSYMQLENFPGAVNAFERAVEMESAENGQTLADLGEAILMVDPQELPGRAGQLFENALALTPGNGKALFYSGMAAAQRGDNLLAADRWEALLATSPPPNVADILRERIAEFRAGTRPRAAAGTNSGPVINVTVSVGPAAQAAGLKDATVFIIARDPNQPSPPIAAVRRRLSELPANVPIGDADAMIPGRVPSAYANLEIIARISLTGEPIAQSGDWFGQQMVRPAASGEIALVIDQQVP